MNLPMKADRVLSANINNTRENRFLWLRKNRQVLEMGLTADVFKN
jgi:hypothetical protein